MRGGIRGAGRGLLRFGAKDNGGVPVLRRWCGALGDRDETAVGPDQEENLGRGGQRVAAGPGGDARACCDTAG